MLLKPNGFLVIHDENKDKNKKLGLIKRYGYRFIFQFELTDEIWWREFYTPLESLIKRFRNKYSDDFELINELDRDQREIDKCKSNTIIFSSFFVIMQKK